MSEKKKKEYKVHRGYIARTSQTAKLYAEEKAAALAIEHAAEQIARILKLPRAEFWTDALPTELFNILESWDHDASETAASIYLASRGWRVTPPKDSGWEPEVKNA